MDGIDAAQANEGLYLQGSVGTGKTTRATGHLQGLLDRGVPAREILVFLPQRALAEPYREVANDHVGGRVDILTISGLARRMIQRFWPLVAEDAGFDGDRPPNFLTLETAQYFMSRVTDPLREEGAFAGLSIAESRLYSQLIDNINKAALVGFPPSEISERLKGAWIGSDERKTVFDDAQRAADRYLQMCRENNLLGFGLQLQVFRQHLWPNDTCRNYLKGTYRHLIADNIEEGVPVSHDILLEWIPEMDSALIICDEGGGYRKFLGADPQSARRLKDCCEHHMRLEAEEIGEEAGDPASNGQAKISGLGEQLSRALQPHKGNLDSPGEIRELRERVGVIYQETYPEMLEAVGRQVKSLIETGTEPEDIVVLAPFLSDTLRHELSNLLTRLEVPFSLRRPSRPLSKEPAVKALLAFSAIGHPAWRVQLSTGDLAQAFSFSTEDLDPIRAHLLARAVYETDEEGRPRLRPFSDVGPDIQDRVTYRLGEQYDKIQRWIKQYVGGDAQPLDHFLSRIFGEVLSQDGFGFHDDLGAAARADRLVESARKFRQVIEKARLDGDTPTGRLYLKTVRKGVAAAQYVQDWAEGTDEGVLLTPAHTFLVQNRRACHQFWLDVGSTGWHSRIRQPLTHPYVLSRSWETGKEWTDADETSAGLEMLSRLTDGLTRRCTGEVHLGIAGRGRNGQREQGYLLKAFQQLFGRARQ
jgi:superfamily I DNA/RNA helicase